MTMVGKNEICNRENLFGPFLAHNFWVPDGLANSLCQHRHDQLEQGATEPHAGRSMFLLSSGDAGGGITQWPLIQG